VDPKKRLGCSWSWVCLEMGLQDSYLNERIMCQTSGWNVSIFRSNLLEKMIVSTHVPPKQLEFASRPCQTSDVNHRGSTGGNPQKRFNFVNFMAILVQLAILLT
jgi:hypothetical protein